MKVTIIGGGNIAASLLSGLSADISGFTVVEPDAARAAELVSRTGVAVKEVADAVPGAEVLVIAVTPHLVDVVLDQVRGHVHAGQLVLSVAGAITTGHLERELPDGTAVVRCMPNTPAAINEGMIALAAGVCAGPESLAVARELFAPLGRVVTVAESQLDAITALSGSGPAYFYLLAEALIDAGVLLGLSRGLAEELVVHTAAGAGRMLRDSGVDPVRLRAAVSSPGGMTIAAVRELEDRAVRSAMMAAAVAARDRSLQLGREYA